MLAHIGFERGDERLRLLLPDRAPGLGRLAVDCALDGEQFVDAAHDLDRDRRLGQLGEVEEIPPAMRPARGFDDRRGLAALLVEGVVAREGVGLHDPRPVGENLSRILAMTRGRVVVQRRRRPLAAERPVVAHVDPEPARAGLHLREHLHGRVVDMQALGGEHVAAKLGEDGFEGGGASADPVGERRDFDLDAFASKGGALPVQRQMVAELADQDHGEQARAGEAARDRVRRRRRLGTIRNFVCERA